MNHLCDGPAVEIVELESCVYPVWCSSGQDLVMYAFNSIKQALLINNDILFEDIGLAKRFQDNGRIGSFDHLRFLC